jgi:hypothetical protein
LTIKLNFDNINLKRYGMRLIQKIINKFKKKKYEAVVLCKDLPKHMQETRTIRVPNYNNKNCKDPDISMFH